MEQHFGQVWQSRTLVVAVAFEVSAVFEEDGFDAFGVADELTPDGEEGR